MKISKGLTQAYQLQDFAFEALMSLKAVLTGKDGKLNLTREDASAIVSLQKAWQGCQERIAFHRRVPSPGSLRPKPETKRAGRKPTSPATPIIAAPAPAQAHKRLTTAVDVMRPLIKVSLFNAASENDFTLLEENGEHFVSFGDRTRPYREFVEMLAGDAELTPDLLTGDVRANFLTLMKQVSERWNDQITVDFVGDQGYRLP